MLLRHEYVLLTKIKSMLLPNFGYNNNNVLMILVAEPIFHNSGELLHRSMHKWRPHTLLLPKLLKDLRLKMMVSRSISVDDKSV